MSGRRPGEVRAWLGRILADRPSALELVVGPERFPSVLARAFGVWCVVVVGGGLVALLLPRPELPGLSATPLMVIAGSITAFGVVAAAVPHRLPIRLTLGVMWLGPVTAAASMALGGRAFGEVASLTTAVGISASLFLRRRQAVAWVLTTAVANGLVFALQEGHPAPVQRGLLIAVSVLGTAGALTWLVGLVEALADEERRARRALDEAHRELARANDRLGEQVHRQVSEITALGRLRRFLAPQVAAAVLADGDQTMLAPHRRRIAVVFCDLRGFTRFSSDAAPEETIEELHAYFEVLGEQLEAYEATVGTFAGDGVMAYFGDPVPHPDPAGAAVAMSLSVRAAMVGLQERWDRRGYDLGYGIGVAFGYATMGTIGLRARTEYTPLGSVVNLASRLCAVARDGEVLVDGRAYDAVADRVDAEERSLVLRGLNDPVTAYNLVAWRAPADPRPAATEPDLSPR